jgi:glucose-6-phosphate 1-dehydrogenase
VTTQAPQATQENPLLEGLRKRRAAEPCALTIFGASGDLTQRKLFPALYSLAFRNLLPTNFGVVGVARTPMSDDEFREKMRQAVVDHGRDEFRQEIWDELAEGIRYVATDFADDGGEEHVVNCLNALDQELGTAGNRVYYLAVPPSAIETIVVAMGKRRATGGWTRLIIEKPFGHDLESARHLNELVRTYFDESEIFRIDHYLGKETVQNMLVLRFANGIFEPIWNRQFVDHVQITVAESLGIEGRAAFYEQAGAIRDIVQNHLLQLVALTAMEPPIDFSADSVRNEKVKVLKAIHTPGPKHVVRGQYGPGYIEGEEVPGYREEPGVAPDSMTETYVAAKLFVDNWRWADTPFYIRTGKRLPRRETTIAIQFKRAPHPPFELDSDDGLRPNVLLVHVQPDEGVSLAVGAKVPGQGMTIRTVHMDFLYGGTFRTGLPEAYERLILDCMLGDATLFTRADEVEEQWAIVDAMVAPWKRDRPNFPNYAAGTWGPAAAEELLRRDGRSWRRH